MQILLANAKIMFDRTDTAPQSSPMFQDVAEKLAAEMASMDTEAMGKKLGCNRKLAAENVLRYQNFVTAERMPAIMAYNGQAYKHLRAATLDYETLDYAQRHLWITCFLYGMLRPMDAIAPYRMEHTVCLDASDGMPMNKFWRKRLTDVLINSVNDDDGILVHLSTGEYEQLFDWQRVCSEVKVIQPLFYVDKGNTMKVQAVWAKACRGAMTRFIVENRICHPEELSAFAYEGFRYDARLGEEAFPHFVRKD